VTPSLLAWLTSRRSPALASSISMHAEWPFWHATYSGVAPSVRRPG
jgi:hypothetical protein